MQIIKEKHNRPKTLDCGTNQGVKYNEELTIDKLSIPTLIPAAIQQRWLKENTRYAYQEIDIPIRANGYIYDMPFFESFIGGLNKRPYPGSAGHHYEGRGTTDLLLIGGKVVNNGDGIGKAFFKNAFLDTPIGIQLANEFESGMIHFSLVSRTRDQLQKTDDGVYEWHVIASEGAERNDAIDTGAGSMKQKTNEKEDDTIDDITDNNPGVPGKHINEEGDNMPLTKEEIINHLKSNTLTFPEVVQAYGMSDQIVTDIHKNAVNTVNELKALGCDDPVKELKELRESTKANFTIMRNSRLDKEFGFEELITGTGKKANALRVHAGEKLGQIPDKDFDAALKNFKENDIVAKSIVESMADGESKINIVAGDKEKPADQPSGVVGGFEVVKG